MKPLKIALCLILLLNLTGCWSKLELDELTFIFGMYIDSGKEPGTVEVSINAPLPNRLLSSTQSGGSQGKSYSLVTKTAPTITDAVIMIQKDLSRRLEISHIKAVVIGKEYAEQGISEVLDWFKRQPEFPIGTYIMAAPGKAKEIAKLSPVFEQLPDQVLMDFSSQNLTFATTVRSCLLAEANNMGYAMNYLSFGENPDVKEQGEPLKWAGVQGVMLFRKAAMRQVLNTEDSRSLAWAAGNVAGHVALPMYTVKWEEDGKGTASALFYSNHASKKVKMSSDGPVFYIKLKGKASITYFRDAEGHGANEKSGVILQKLREKVIADVTRSIKATQKAGADVLQLGMLMEWNHPAEWKKLQEKWDEEYREAQIVVSADLSIEDFGSVK
ncbi:Ger(x)C family spore germination protein [Paenibacillus sp. PK3_47]|uniref:Ger(x)C family spore germination protein n=1 Tax=Paenibacillus sp. PK3_47 TaxID=2072642 RepID=UPI00201E1F7E|nr:Ger(x)C family spore germination protein [Paenibacillus sp. PK3_47]UQZ36598.1 Ger(x)C family spore germination protein [Paenibacillus sp. PK3_47]